MGIVYEAHDPAIDRTIALKVLREDRVTSKTFVERFLKEARAIGRLSHPNIVTIHDIGEDQGTVYIAMEFLEGISLDRVAMDKRLTVPEIVDLGIRVADALDYAHKKGIVHRDIKPSNIICLPNRAIKISDFGIAHIEDPNAPQMTQTGEILGTPAYMSPEQVMGKSVDGRADLFSLGCILYELATNTRPFQGENLPALFRSVTSEIPAEPVRLNPEIPKGLSKTIMKCLEKEPDNRFQNCCALAESLKQSPGKRKPQEPTPPDVRLKGKSRKTFLFISVLVIMACLAGGGIIYRFANKKPTPRPVPPVAVAKGTLIVESIPGGAQVMIDGSLKGKTPLRIDLPSGKHEVSLTRTDFYDWEAQVLVREGKATPLSVRMTPIEGEKE